VEFVRREESAAEIVADLSAKAEWVSRA